MSHDDIIDAAVDRLRCADPARPTPRDVHAMEHGGYHVAADPDEPDPFSLCEKHSWVGHEAGAKCPSCLAVEALARADAHLPPEPPKKIVYLDGDPSTGYIEVCEPHRNPIGSCSQCRAEEALERADAHLPTNPAERKESPMATGLLDYFPDALAAVAHCSKVGNDQHNPGEPLHWSRGKSDDHADCIVRHMVDRGTVDTDGVRHSAKVAWRALAMLQLEIEAAKREGRQ